MKIYLKTLYGKLRYYSESIFSKNIIIQIVLLALVAFIVATVATIFLKITAIMPTEWNNLLLPKVLWKNLMRVMDQGTMVSDEGSWLFLLTMLFTTVVGLILVSTLISIITEGFETKVEELRKGRSAVYEKNHIVILGWSSKLFVIIDELIIGHYLSHRNKKRLCITILADKDKTEMEDSIADHCKNISTVKIVCRSGNPIILEKLKKLSLHNARSILILAPEISNPDIFVFKTALAILGISQSVKYISEKVIIAELQDPKIIDLIKKQYCSRKEYFFQPIISAKIVSEIVAQASLQKGLSKIYEELLKFNKTDNEIYFANISYFHSLHKKNLKFKEILNLFRDSCLIGFVDNNKVIINPLAYSNYLEHNIQPNDQLIFIARSKKMIKIDKHQNFNKIDKIKFPENSGSYFPDSQTIIFGYNQTLTAIVDELENYVGDQSTTTIVAKISPIQVNDLTNYFEKEPHKYKQKISFHPITEEIIDENIFQGLGTAKYNNIILLNSAISSKSDNASKSSHQIEIMEAQDAQTIRSLLHIHNFFNENPEKEGENFSIVTEMGLSNNKNLVPRNRRNDFIVSDEIISSIFAQTALNKDRGKAYLDILFSARGSEIYLKDAKYYVNLGEKINLFMIIRSAIRFKEIVIGYIKNDEIYLNPPKNKEIVLNENDKIITLAEEYTFLN